MLQPIPKPKLKIMNLTNHATENYSGTRVWINFQCICPKKPEF
jgi:hypothetical protein